MVVSEVTSAIVLSLFVVSGLATRLTQSIFSTCSQKTLFWLEQIKYPNIGVSDQTCVVSCNHVHVMGEHPHNERSDQVWSIKQFSHLIFQNEF